MKTILPRILTINGLSEATLRVSGPEPADMSMGFTPAARILRSARSGDLALPLGVSYTFAESYEKQIRAGRTLAIVLPLALFAMFMLLCFQLMSDSATLLVGGNYL